MKWVLAFLAAAGVAVLGSRAVFAQMSKSATATKYGIDNFPDNAEDQQRLLILYPIADRTERFLRQWWPLARITNVYRADALTAAMRAVGYHPSETSLHLDGLAYDIGGIPEAELDLALDRVRAHVLELYGEFREVIAEHDVAHMHFGIWDPLRIRHTTVGATRWRRKTIDGEWQVA